MRVQSLNSYNFCQSSSRSLTSQNYTIVCFTAFILLQHFQKHTSVVSNTSTIQMFHTLSKKFSISGRRAHQVESKDNLTSIKELRRNLLSKSSKKPSLYSTLPIIQKKKVVIKSTITLYLLLCHPTAAWYNCEQHFFITSSSPVH